MVVLILTLMILIYLIMETIYRDYFKYKKVNVHDVDIIENMLDQKRSDIRILSDRLSMQHSCKLCKGVRFDTNVISFTGKEYSQFSKKRPHKFLKVTCMDCGITNFYNLNRLWGPDGLDPLPIDDPIYERFLNMAEHFNCAYCAQTKAIAKIVTNRKKGFRHMLSPEPSELVCLCCKNCGWSMFHDLKLILTHRDSYA